MARMAELNLSIQSTLLFVSHQNYFKLKQFQKLATPKICLKTRLIKSLQSRLHPLVLSVPFIIIYMSSFSRSCAFAHGFNYIA